MEQKYTEILNANGGTMTFELFVSACQQQGVDARLWVRAKHHGTVFTWITSEGVHMISTSPQS